MIVGVDARPLSSKNLSGIGNYLLEVLDFLKFDDKNQYILYSNSPIVNHRNILDYYESRITPGKIGTLWVCYKLKNILEEDKVELFWGTQHMLPLNTKNIKLVVTVHDLALIIHPDWGSVNNMIMQNIFCKKSCKIADRIIAVSNSTKNDLINILNIPESKVRVNHLGTSQDIIEIVNLDLDSKLEFLKNKNYFLYLGNIEPRKNIPNIIRAFNLYKQKDTNDTYLIIAGGLGWKYKPILKELSKSKYKDFIKMVGYVSNKEKSWLLSNSKVLLFPSNYEGFGLPILEGMKYGVPVITTRISSMPEVGGKFSYYINKPTDFKKMSEYLSQIINLSQYERDSLKRNEQDWIKNFTWEKCGARTLEVFNDFKKE